MNAGDFYLGTHRPNWLWSVTDVPLFVSHRVLRDRKKPFPKATTRWALDSGGFTELNLYGRWKTTPEEYVAAVRRYVDELGNLQWASPQDWMCEPWVVAKTGLSVRTHQQLTTANYLVLKDLAPDLPFAPVLQGWEFDDYHAHADAYAEAGVDLTKEPVVGIGSVCRRQATGQIAGIFDSLQSRGLKMHGFGVKSAGLALYADNLTSADSLAWSYGARQDSLKGIRHCAKKTCANCLHYALAWRDRVLYSLETRQLSLFGGCGLMKNWNPWVRFIWDHWNLDTITWEQRAEEVAIGYQTELEEFAEENPRPRLRDYMTGLSGQWRYQTGMERAA